MKKILLSLALAFFAGVSFGQVQYGLKAGVNFANQNFSTSGASASLSSLTSFHLHGIADFSISPMFSLQPGIGISGKGFKAEEEDVDAKINILYLDIPVNGLVKFPVPSFGKVFLGGGPYAGINLSENYEFDGEDVDDDEQSYKTADFGLNLIGGVEFSSGLTLNANYGFGMVNVLKEADDTDVTVKNKVFTVSIGFLF